MSSNDVPLVSSGTAHVGELVRNKTREDLQLDQWFLDSVRENGVLVPMVLRLLTPEEKAAAEAVRARELEDHGEGPAAAELPPLKYKIVMGDRRHAAAMEAGQSKVPVYVVDSSLRDAAEDYIQALIENDQRGRASLTAVEEALALFSASDAGLDVDTLARRTGRGEKEVHKAVLAGRQLSPGTRRKLTEECQRQTTTEELLAFAEFDADPEAVSRLATAHTVGRFEFQLCVERERRARELQREELKEAGIRLIDDGTEIPKGAEFVDVLYDDQELQLDPEEHKQCPGHAVVWDEDSDSPDAVLPLCLDPEGNGHQREPEVPTDDDSETPADDTSPRPATPPAVVEPDGIPYALKVTGNKHWRAAKQQRRQWLIQFCGRKSAPKELRPWISGQWLMCPKPVAQWTGDVPRVGLVAELLGHNSKDEAATRVGWIGSNPSVGRLALCDFAVIAACYEKRIDQVQTWRTDEPEWDTKAIRGDARAYLKALASFGYKPSPIEIAVMDNVTYEPGSEADADSHGRAAEAEKA